MFYSLYYHILTIASLSKPEYKHYLLVPRLRGYGPRCSTIYAQNTSQRQQLVDLKQNQNQFHSYTHIHISTASTNFTMTETTTTNNEKPADWKRVTLTPIKENDDGTNNYSEFRQKSKLELDAAGYYKYIDGPDYNPPIIPILTSSIQIQGIDPNGASVTVTVPGNETAVAAARKSAEDWLNMDKKALAIVVKAIPSQKLYIIRDCTSAHDAWRALKNEYEPSNALTAVTIKQQIIGNACKTGDDPVHWLQVMIQLYGKLRDADQNIMPDAEFASHLVTLMTDDKNWRFCRDSLLEKLRVGDALRRPISSKIVIDRLKNEEVNQGISPSMVSINALMTSRRDTRAKVGDAVAGVYSAVPLTLEQRLGGSSSNQESRKVGRTQQRQDRRSTPYNSQQRSESLSRPVCENTFCETPVGHSKSDCFAYTGGKQGKYPVNYRGRKDIHLAPEARIAARRKYAIETGGRGRQADSANRFAGMTQLTNDDEENVKEVFNPLAFMAELPQADDNDEIGIDEEVYINAVALNTEVPNDDSINHDTGASRHIFHNQQLFHDYETFDTPLNVHGFGSNLSTIAVGKGKILLKSSYAGVAKEFSISNALHIPTARCNLISGSRIDKKGVSTTTGNGNITYLTSTGVPFATGSIVRDLYRMDVQAVEVSTAGSNLSSSQSILIAAMTTSVIGAIPSITGMFDPGTESEEIQRRGFTTV